MGLYYRDRKGYSTNVTINRLAKGKSTQNHGCYHQLSRCPVSIFHSTNSKREGFQPGGEFIGRYVLVNIQKAIENDHL
jgi:hypothetical protein